MPGRDDAEADARQAVHLGRVDAVEVDRVRMRGAVAEPDPQPLALARAQRRAGYAAVVGPGRELDAGRDLDLLVDRDQLPLAQHAAAREPAGAAVVEVAQQLGGVEAVGGVVDAARRPGSRGGRAPSVLVCLGRAVAAVLVRSAGRGGVPRLTPPSLATAPAPRAGASEASIRLRLKRCTAAGLWHA